MTTWRRWQDWGTVILGVLLILSPWLLGFTGLTMMACSAWAIGALAVLLAASVRFAPGGRPSQAAQS